MCSGRSFGFCWAKIASGNKIMTVANAIHAMARFGVIILFIVGVLLPPWFVALSYPRTNMDVKHSLRLPSSNDVRYCSDKLNEPGEDHGRSSYRGYNPARRQYQPMGAQYDHRHDASGAA